ncbi:MAG: Ig domain protein group 2 domain protein [Gemmatimonadetes bacterium]|nr:Ig domain protein group 2 domain protein [Gemmatimonadota bacterium]
MRRFLTKCALALGIVTLACSSGDLTSPDTTSGGSNNVPTTVVITPPSSPDIVVGTTVNLVVAVKNASGQDINGLVIVWSTSDATVASITQTGVVTGVKVGSATITGTVGTRSATLVMNVIPVPVRTVAVTLKGALIVGEAAPAAFVASDASGNALSGRTAVWSSRNAAVASVTAAGVVTAVSVGTATIDAVVGGITGSATVVVNPVPPAPVKAVNVSVKTNLIVAETVTAFASTLDASGGALTGRAVTWSSSNSDVVSVSAIGAVTAVAAGTATISATSEGIQGTATIVVSLPPSAVKTVMVRLVDPTPFPGLTSQAIATTLDVNGVVLTGKSITWSSSNSAVATVSELGIVTAVSSGAAAITATSEGQIGSAIITVLPPPGAIGTVIVTANPQTITVGHTSTLTVVLRDNTNAIVTGHSITYSTSNPTVAVVSATGIVTGVAPGTVSIFAQSEGRTGTVSMVVSPVAISQVLVNASSLTVQPLLSTQASATTRDADNNVLTGRTVTWASSNPAAAIVSTTGLVTGVASGTTSITATSEGISGSVTISVPPVATVNATAVNTIRQPGQTTQATASLLDAASVVAVNRSVTWSSSNPAVATVNSSTGLVTALGPGTTNIQAASEGITGFVVITVPPVATINVTAVATILQPTQTTQATAVLLDASAAVATNRTVTWSSTNPAAATVSASGLVTAVASGTTSIKATSEGINGSVTVTVPPVATVVVTASANNLLLNGTSQMTAVPKDAGNNALTNRSVTWTSGTPAVATVSSTGLVTAHQLGTSIITGTVEGIAGNFIITVIAPVGSIAVSSTANGLLLGQSANVSALILDTFGVPVTTIPPVWSSSNPAKATVTQGGVVTAVNGGTFANVLISATAGGVTSSTSIAVTGHMPEVVPNLPTFMNTAAPAAPDVGGTIINVNSSAQLTAALATANPGDVIQLANNILYTGNFLLPNKGSVTKWITIRPANFASLPAEGTRMTPLIAASLNLPMIRSPNSEGAFKTAASANHYRIIGLDIGLATSQNQIYSIVAFESATGQNTLAQVPHDLVLDRSWVHGNAVQTVRRCVVINSGSTAIIDSYLSDCHELGSDSQAILGYNGPGPFKIVNNYLEGAGETVMFGGADPDIPNLVPSDIEIRRNHFFKPLAWRPLWTVKNHLELKNSQRVLIEGNVFDQVWSNAQTGTSVLFKSTNQSGNCPWCVTQDVTCRFNQLTNVGNGFNIAGAPEGNVITHARRISVTDNLVYKINIAPFDGDGRGLVMGGDPADVTVAHNTFFAPTNTGVLFGPLGQATVRFSFRDNIFGGGQYGGVIGDGFSGVAAFSNYAPDGSMKSNVFIYTNGTPPGPFQQNYYDFNIASVGFVSVLGGDFHLAPTSQFKAFGTEGRDPGADLNALATAIQGVVIP